MNASWIAQRMHTIEGSGIRKIFELAATLKNPVNLSIGQPDFDVPQPIKQAAKEAIDQGANGYTVTQGLPNLRAKIAAEVQSRLPHPDREVLVTTGTSGALVLAMLTTINPGDEVILFDPHFVSYPHLVNMCGGTPIWINTYPTFQIDVNRVREAVTPKTKAILFSSPSNPTGVCLSKEVLNDLAQLAEEKGILLISDEIYRSFVYDQPFVSAADFNQNVLVVDGFGKTYSMTGWRIGFAHGPKAIIQEMAKLQQFTFVCAPSVVQHAAIKACDYDVSPIISDYRRKRDLLIHGLQDRYEFSKPGGAFYLFPKTPWGTGTEFVTAAIEHELLIIPGNAFSKQDTHFRVSYAAKDEILQRGMDILNKLARH